MAIYIVAVVALVLGLTLGYWVRSRLSRGVNHRTAASAGKTQMDEGKMTEHDTYGA